LKRADRGATRGRNEDFFAHGRFSTGTEARM
jgi:hypothetical protein